jgi:hypothetical protein
MIRADIVSRVMNEKMDDLLWVIALENRQAE